MQINHLIVDVDGTLTEGGIFYADGNVEIKAFNIKDGAILKALPSIGIKVIMLTGRTSSAVQRRAADMDCTVIQGVENKVEALKSYFGKCSPFETCAYIGDDLNDYAAMKMCAFKACPADAATEIKELCDYVSKLNGGKGAVRDICEYLLKQTNQYNAFLAYYNIYP